MCIIAYKPKGVDLMPRTTIKNCMENNPNGAGYCFNTNEGVFIRKGFWSTKKLDKALLRDLQSFNLKAKDIDIIIHSRIATSGLTKPENCHPFPITDDIAHLRKVCDLTPLAVVHNGMIDIHDADNKTLSDTMIFVKDVLAKINFLKPLPTHIEKLLNVALYSSKVLIMGINGIVFTTGNFTKDEGIFYSNATYKPETWPILTGKTPWYGYNEKFDYATGYTREDSIQPCDTCGCESNKIVFAEDMYLCPDCIKDVNDYKDIEAQYIPSKTKGVQ